MDKSEKLTLAKIVLSTLIFALSFLPFWSELVKLIISIFAFLIVGYDVIFDSIKGIFHGEFLDEKFLMMIASIGAFILGEYHEAVAVMLFYQLGEFLQDLATEKSKKSITALLDLRPEFVNVLRNGETQKVYPESVLIGETIIVEAGENIALDGKIITGSSCVNTSAITGESLPKEIGVSDEVFAGYINLESTIQIEVTNTYKNSKIAKIINIIENSEENKSKSQKFITKFAKIYTPVVVALAVILAFIPSIITGNWATWIHRALLFLVVSCPCALVISIPLSYFAGIGGATKRGILIKGANHIETLSKTGLVAFDKTGTLSKGSFEIVKINAENCSENELLKFCAIAESKSNHPIAKSIIKKYGTINDISNDLIIKNFSGFGVIANYDNEQIIVGKYEFLQNYKIKLNEVKSDNTLVFVAKNSEYLGYIEIADTAKDTSKIAINRLHNLNIKTALISGDKISIAQNFANSLNIDYVKAELLPEEKIEEIKKLKIQNKCVTAFVGDGINDAPALKTSDVGIAMGGIGSDLANQTADVVLMDDNPEKVADLILISRKTQKIVKENIVFAIGFKIIVLILGTIGLASMWMAVFADVGVSLIAILNSLRAFKIKK